MIIIKHGSEGGQLQINLRYLKAMRRESQIQEMQEGMFMSARNLIAPMQNMSMHRPYMAAGGSLSPQEHIPMVEATLIPSGVKGVVAHPDPGHNDKMSTQKG